MAVTVEVEFTPGSWTTIPAADVAWFSTKRGKNHELSRTERGTLSLLLRNLDRDYDPDNSASPHAGNLLPMKRVRVRETVGATTYNLFQGTIDGWPQSWEQGLFQQVLLTAADAFKVLGLAKVAGTLYTGQLYTDTVDDAVLGATNAAHYYMDDAAGASVIDDRLGFNYDLSIGANVTLADAARPPTYGRPRSVLFGPVNDAGDGLYRATGPEFGTDPQVFAWSVWLRLDTLSTDGYIVGFETSGDEDIRWSMANDGTASVVYVSTFGPVTLTASLAGVFEADGEWHHYGVRGTLDSGVPGSLSVAFLKDGSQIGSDIDSAAVTVQALGTINSFFAGGGGSGGGNHGLHGNMAQLLVMNNNAPSVTQMEELGRPVWDYVPAALAGQQIESILDSVQWPLADRGIDAGTVQMVAYTPGVGDGILDKLLSIAEDSERGLFFPGTDGKLYFWDADTIVARAAQATFGSGAGEVPYATVETRFDDQDVWNQIAITGNAQVRYVEDAASIGDYGSRLLQITTTLAETADADALAAALLAAYKDPQTRPVKLVIEAVGEEVAKLEQILGRGQGDTVRVILRPPAGGDDIILDSQIEGVAVECSDVQRRATFDLAYESWVLIDDSLVTIDSVSAAIDG